MSVPSSDHKVPAVMMIVWPALAMMIVASTGSIAQLADSSEYGLGALSIYLLAALLFLVPVALVSAELATGWSGGVFRWVGAAFGDRWGFQATWLQWVQSVALYPTLLSFGAAALASAARRDDLEGNGVYVGAVVLILFWTATAIASRGLRFTARLSSIGLLLGTLLPALALIALLTFWLGSGRTSQAPLGVAEVLPKIDGISSLALIVGTFIAFAGLEVNAVHIRDLVGRPRTYLFALVTAVVLILVMYIPGSIAISVAVAADKVDLNAGATQAFDAFAQGFGVDWLGPVLSATLAFGALAAAITWVAGPSRGLLAVGRAGFLPPTLQRTNAAGVQVPILLVQGVIVTALTAVFVVLPNTSSAFAALQAVTAILYMSMYLLMFAAALRLRRTQPDRARGFRVPAIRLVAVVGMLAASAAIAFSLTPPEQFGTVPWPLYAGALLATAALLAAGPLLLERIRRPEWLQAGSEFADGADPTPDAARG